MRSMEGRLRSGSGKTFFDPNDRSYTPRPWCSLIRPGLRPFARQSPRIWLGWSQPWAFELDGSTLGAVHAVVLLALIVSAGPEKQPEKEAPLDPRVKAVLKSAAPSIERCVAAYLKERPKARGFAQITNRYTRLGKVLRTKVQTELPKSEALVLCLRRVGRGLTMPKLAKFGQNLSIPVPVYTGAKFEVERKPDKKKPEPKPPKDERPLGDFTLRPGGFFDQGWGVPEGLGTPAGNNETGDEPEGGDEPAGEEPEAGQGTGQAESSAYE